MVLTKDDNGYYFDQGTHIPTYTGIEEIDDCIFSEKDIDENWNKFETLETANFFNGKWHLENSLINASHLEHDVYKTGIFELLHTSPAKLNPEYKSARDYCIQVFGPTFTANIQEEVTKKLYGTPLDKLSLRAIEMFGHSRLIVSSKEMTRKLKEVSYFDDILGVHDAGERKLPNPHIYPKSKKGIGYWVEQLELKLESKNIQVIKNCSIEKIELDNNTVTGVTLSNAERQDLDLLVWTLPPFLAFQAAGKTLKGVPPSLRTSGLYHFVVDQDYLIKDSLYLWNWDLDFKSFRVTLYNNSNNKRHAPHFGLTVETLSGREEALSTSAEGIYEELLRTKIVSEKAKIISQMKHVIPNTFPVPTTEFIDNVSAQADSFDATFSNALLLGRASGKAWFINDALIHAQEKISKLEI